MFKCCAYGTDGATTTGYECINIPGAEKKTTTASSSVSSNFCGNGAGLVTMSTTKAGDMTICCEYGSES